MLVILSMLHQFNVTFFEANIMIEKPFDLLAYESEYLGMSCGTIFERPKLVLSLRINPENSFAVHNLALTPEQARRLHDDLESMFQSYSCLRLSDPLSQPTAKRKPRKRKDQ